MRRITFLLIGMAALLAGCQTPSDPPASSRCTPRLEDAGRCSYGSTFTIQTVSSG